MLMRSSCAQGRNFLLYARRDVSSTNATTISLNCENALIKSYEGKSLSELSKPKTSIEALQGIGPVHLESFNKLGIKSISDLANYKFYKIAKSIATLAVTEGTYRPDDSTMNINKAVDKAYETKTLREITMAPVDSLQGISEMKGEIFNTMGVHTVKDLANLKYCQWAESIIELSKYEE